MTEIPSEDKSRTKDSYPCRAGGKTRRRNHNKTKKRLKWLLILVVVFGAAVACAVLLPLTLKGAKKDVLIKVPKNATVEMVRDSLEKYLGDDYAHHVMMLAKMFGFAEHDRHGAYLIPKGTSPLRAGRRLAKGGQTGVTLTINGQRTKEDLARRISSVLDISPEEMLAALNNHDLLDKYETDSDRVMAMFLNNSYQFYWNATPEQVIERMNKEYHKFWNNSRLNRTEALRLSPRAICIIASIVDEETNVADEKGRIGRLYINRYNIDMPLQADPTVRYALGDFTLKRISAQDLKTPSLYNTYLNKGLPPGPIRTPDPKTIDAVLHSSDSDDLYMCADTSFNGRHFFSADYNTHLNYSKKYHEALNRRNIHR